MSREVTMTIYTDTTHILLIERIADLRREADTERMLRTAFLARPSRRPFRPRVAENRP
jgi:hypothetical protein